mmetsp:Transcript_20819/g.28942  ORF Transcript_20819/g.28942 Transcript_20819/m.28942 type:complete len:116 (+) Transcript_20819:260-607(+)
MPSYFDNLHILFMVGCLASFWSLSMGFTPNPSITSTYGSTNKCHILFHSTNPEVASKKKKKKKTNKKNRRDTTIETPETYFNSGRARKSKKDMEALIRSIGLEPVTSSKNMASSE